MNRRQLLMPIALLVIAVSCKKDPPVEQPIRDLLTSGTWTISHFLFEIPLDTTVDYREYTMVFSTDGKLLSTNNNGVTGNGTWKLIPLFGGPEHYLRIDMEGNDFNYLPGGWSFESMTPTQIELATGILKQFEMTLVKN